MLYHNNPVYQRHRKENILYTSLQRLLKVSHNQYGLTFPRKNTQRGRGVSQPYQKAFWYSAHLLVLIDYYLVCTMWLLL